ncbi:MAG: ABC transporter ATP-binding protein [Actinomycetota bacterium]
MPEPAIEIRGLRKSYGPIQAVRGIDLFIEHGEVFALLGPNGAGKTTTVEILEGHRKRSAGEVAVLGFDPAREERAFKERIGIVLQEVGLEQYLTVEESIDMYRGYYPQPRPLDELVELVGLQAKRDTRVLKLSGGQRRRLDVAIGLAGDPELLFLDEPTTGFDPSARRSAWQMVKNLAALGKTIFLTTHYMDEAQYLADRVGIIVDGKIVALGPPEELEHRTSTMTRISFCLEPDAPSLPERLLADASIDNGTFQFQTEEPMRLLHDLTGWALANRTGLQRLKVSGASLEDVYLELTAEAEGRGAR